MFNLNAKWVRLSAGFAAAAVLLWASGIAPQAYNLIEGNGTPAARGSTLNFANTASVTWSCTTTGIVTACSATASGSGGSGGGIVTYSSGAALTPSGTQFVAIGGGGQASATESDVRIGAPSAATISSMFVNFDLPPGGGNSIAVTWRKAGSSQTLTCTVSGAADTCSDTAHSFTVAQGDLVDIQLVTTGSVLVAPGLTIATAYGTSGTAGYLTVQNNGTPLPQEPVLNIINGTNTTAVCADNPGNTSTDCKINASGGGGGGTPSANVFQALAARSTTLTFGTASVVNDIVVCEVGWEGGSATTSTLTDSASTSYTQVVQVTGTTENIAMYVGTLGASPGTLTFTMTSPGGFQGLACIEFIAGSVTATVDTSVASTVTSGNVAITLTPTATGDTIVIGGQGTSSGGAFLPPNGTGTNGGMLGYSGVQASGSDSGGIAYSVAPQATTNPVIVSPSYTNNGAVGYAMIALKHP